MSIKIEMENIGGFTSKKIFKIEKGLNVIEAPNAGGKTSFIKGIRALILPLNSMENKRDFLNISFKSGNVSLVENGKKFSRDLIDSDGLLSISGNPMVKDGDKVDSLCIATRENELMDKIEKGKTLKSMLEDYSEAKYFKIAQGPFILKKILNLTNSELARQSEEYSKLRLLKQNLNKLNVDRKQLEKKWAKLPEIPSATSETMSKNQTLIEEKSKERGGLLVKISNQISIMKDRTESIKRKEEEITDYTQRIEKFYKRHPNPDQELGKFTSEITNRSKKRGNLQLKISQINGRLDVIKKAQHEEDKFSYGFCPVCESKIQGENLKKIEKNLMDEYSSVTKNIGLITANIDTMERERQNLADEYAGLKLGKSGAIKMKSDSERRLKDVKREFENAKIEKENLKIKVRELYIEIANLKKNIDPKIFEIINDRAVVKKDIDIVNNEIKRTEKAIAERGKTGETIQHLDKKKKFLNSAITYLKREEERRLKEAVNSFNEEAKKIYKILDFKDFENIYIDDYTFEVNVIRHKEGKSIRQPIKSLSGSERGSIGLILMLAGREKFVKDFPMFVLDAVSEDYDKTRLKHFLNYILKKVPYLIVTTLSPLEKADKITIKHSL